MLSSLGKITDFEIAELLKTSHQTIATAESMTGGMIAARLTNIPGSSDYFIGGVISYHDRIKIQELQIPPKIFAQEGAVSAKIATLMAEGIKRKFKTDIGLAITGCAGPDPLPPAPVGLVYLSLVTNASSECKELTLERTRSEIREKATQAAMGLLWFHLGGGTKL
ncbi:hypothetical protein A2526_05970 [candidate division WOR-1 bacterium RIFOXYD2_FULL_36_8]|uniref:CinA C-terminal domain-containing protein n=1 Tax=candidate division WOR-1 bacterium RIFOXYB2_FULL_36_35 TaxID=1802578 RepID=A0A1F4S3L4_UNCSA|nr:MAG: hypothetical protein A2230_08895 [candidate division WOR-1 bacterium RIFOXYA2_FULL_36_21]OGC15026.1 MAG: hypothetical protein A2290_01535 [candidate division WOR-1 bacterium RIFOXYB2_FULL_36_35]OGC18738.1 MAG: hypothetical protein A2282_07315 [candidate division WOR-1 bacterium RIFOXYA12_FULL_36_13]OGC37436.1 MAG: hypothetical protein A2526_05970 [candidate division WOR-1 bacterium RIFOXYD2_FULL_36_8]